jgi:hypothetical protein
MDLQIVGRRFDDLGVLRTVKIFESMCGPQRDWPMRSQIAACALNTPDFF